MRKNSVGNRFPAGVPVITLGVSSIIANEGQTLSITINRTASSLVSTCRFYTVPQTAGNADFTEHEGTLVTFAAGETSKQVNVTIASDALNEADETFFVQVANPSMASIGAQNKALVTITGQVQAVTVASVSSPTVNEGSPLVFNVVLSAPTNQSTEFSYVLSGTASNILDFTNTPSFTGGVTLSGAVLTVPSGVSVFTVTFPTIDDTALESPETVILNVGGVQGTGTINSDDVAIQSVYTDTNVTEGAALVFNVTLTAAPSVPKTFTFSRSGTATVGSDFNDAPTFSNGVVLSAGQVTVPVGVAAFTVTYPTINDSLDEPEETIVLTIGGVQGTGIILSDDGVLPAYSTRLIEAPYFALTGPQRSGLADNDGYVMALVERNIAGLSSPNYNLRGSNNNTTFTAIGDANYAPMGYLLNAVNKVVETFTFSAAVDMADIVFGVAPILGYINDEVVEVTAYNSTTAVATVKRGVVDSVPQAHDIGARLYIAVPNIGKDPTEYVLGNMRYYKVLPKSGATTYPEASAASNVITLAGRAGRPYPPNMFKINGEYYPTTVDAGDITVTWQHRNRIEQVTNTVDYNDVLASGAETVYLTNRSDVETDYTNVRDAVIKDYELTTDNGITLLVGEYERTVIGFDDLSNSAFNGRTLLSAILRFDSPGEVTTPYSLKVAKLKKPFVETEVNWQRFSAAVDAETDGFTGATDIDLATVITFTDTETLDGYQIDIAGEDFTAMIQSMLGSSAENYGLLIGNLGGGTGGFYARSSENIVPTLTPMLILEFAAGTAAGEEGQTSTIQFFYGDELVREVSGITDSEYVYTNANIIADGDPDLLTVKLFDVRDGIPSWKAHEHTFGRPFTGVPLPTAINITGGVEGGNAVFTVVMNGPYIDQVDHGFAFSGNYQPADIGTITYSDDVEDNGDGTLLVPAGVDEFTITIPIVTDALAETGENITLTVGAISNTINLSNP